MSHPRPRFDLGYLRPELERPLDVRECLGVRVDVLGRPRRVEGRGQRASAVVRGVPVARQLARDAAAVRLHPFRVLGEELGHADVQRDPLTGQEIVVDRFVDQRVTEAVFESAGLGDEHLLFDRLTDRVEQPRVVESGDRRNEPVVGMAADHGCAAQHLARVVGQCVDAREHDVAQRRWDCIVERGTGGEQLLHEERVAVGTLVCSLDELRAGMRSDNRRDELAGLVTVEARQVDAFGRARTIELGERGPQGMAAVQIVGSVGADDDDPGVVHAAREEHEQVARRPVRPVEVLEHEHGRHSVADPFEDTEHLLEEGRGGDRLGRRTRVQLGHERREILTRGSDHGRKRRRVERAVQRPQRLHDGPERQRAIDELHAVPGEHERRLAQPLDHLGYEPGLSDAGLPGDQHGRGRLVVDGRFPDRVEARELRLPADEAGAGNARRHAFQSY